MEEVPVGYAISRLPQVGTQIRLLDWPLLCDFQSLQNTRPSML